MKRNLISLFILLLFIASCSKAPQTIPEEDLAENEKYLLSFTVSGFSQDLLPFPEKLQSTNALSTNSLVNIRDYFNTLKIIVYYRNDVIDSVIQYADDPDFGQYSKYYPPSQSVSFPYNVVIIGAMLDNPDEEIVFEEMDQITYSRVSISPNPADAFFAVKTFVLSPEPTHETIQLQRFVGRLDVQLDEEIPNTADQIEVTIENTAKYFMPVEKRGYHIDRIIKNDNVPYNTVKRIKINPEDTGRQDFSFSTYFMLKSILGSEAETSKVVIRAYNQDGKEITKREIPNVIIQANKRTKLRGLLFTSPPNMGFDMEIESDWDSEIPEFKF